MFDSLNPIPQDKILELIALFRDDPRTDKIDLGVGVYKDASGLTPVMRAVKTAERQLWERETTKTYTALAGDPAFGAAMIEMILGDGDSAARAAAGAAPLWQNIGGNRPATGRPSNAAPGHSHGD